MKKVKKLLAMIMAMTMVLGMAMTVSAAPQPVDVTITDLDEDIATVTYVRIIEPDTEEPTGWTFTEAGNAFKDSISSTADAQDVIWGLLRYKTPSLNIPDSADADPVTITAGALENAFNAVVTTNNASIGETTATFKADTAGVYAIKATTNGDYSYSPMGAYVAFVYGSDGSLTLVDDVEVRAKKAPTKVEKSASEEDKVVAVGKTVTYTIETTVPYFQDSVTNVEYKITDTIRGAEYLLNKDDKLEVTVKLGDVSVGEVEVVDVDTAASDGTHTTNQTFTIDLSDIAEDRNNANKTLVLTYQAVVKELTVNNTAKPVSGDHQYEDSIVNLYTGTITMTKYDSDNDNIKLGGAGFKVYYKVKGEGTSETIYWAIANEKIAGVTGEYYVTGWTTDEELATEIFTEDNNGTVKLSGLDDSTTYYFKETKAPDGYSINTTDEDAVWDDNSQATAKVGTASMADTKLAALPSTGGIGTTIFTIGGCAIMIAAAALFFVSRRKSEEN